MSQLRRRACREIQPVRLFVEELESRFAPTATSLAPLTLGNASVVPGSLLVTTVSDQCWEPSNTLRKLVSKVSLIHPGLYQVYLNSGVTVSDGLRVLSKLPSVQHVEPNFQLHVAARPNDPFFDSQWALANAGNPGADIHALTGWNITTNASNIVVAVIDSGVDYNHPDLAANMWRNGGEIPNNGVDDDNNGYVDDVLGYDFINNDADPQDDHGHGTHVAGIIGAVGNNGLGITGVAWSVRIMALKFLDQNGSGTVADAVRAIDYAVRMGARIINASWGGAGYSTILAQAIGRAESAGVLFVTAAGNNGTNNDLVPNYPASYPNKNILSVAATDRNDHLAAFSNFGSSTVHLAAPGVSILSTLPRGQYAFWSGTSMAAPHVSGAAALLWSLHPDWNFRQVKECLLRTADPLPSLTNKVASAGRLNLAGALAYTPGQDLVGPRVVRLAWLRDVNSLLGFQVTFSEIIASLSSNAITMTGPNGQSIRLLSVRRLNNDLPGSTFEVRISRQSLPGTYQLQIGPNVTDLAGNWMDQNNDGINGQIPQDCYVEQVNLKPTYVYQTGVINAPISDLSVTSIPLSIKSSALITKLVVSLHIQHTWTSDLVVSLTSPSGKTITLISRRGGAGKDFAGTVFSDEATVPISAGVAPFRGVFRPEQALAAFRGDNTAGIWTLRVRDVAPGDTGRVVRWALYIEGEPLTSSSRRTTKKSPPSSKSHVLMHRGASVDKASLDADPFVLLNSYATRPSIIHGRYTFRNPSWSFHLSEFLNGREFVLPSSNAPASLPGTNTDFNDVVELHDCDLANYMILKALSRISRSNVPKE